MDRISRTFAQVERSLWHHRIAILILACILTLVRLCWVYSPLVADAQYPVREMLVNSASGFVRRGLSGDIILFLSNSLGGTPMAWATALLCGLCMAMFAACIHIFRKLPDDQSLTPLVLAPWGLLFIAYDFDMMVRKEAFGVMALSFTLIGALAPQAKSAFRWLVFGCLLMPIAILMHEVNATLAGSMFVATWLLLNNHPSLKRPAYRIVAFGVSASMIATFAALTHMTTDPKAMCSAIGDPDCQAPFSFFTDTINDGHALVASEINPARVPIALLMMFATLLPFLGIQVKGKHALIAITACLAISIPVLPLFFIATDYGRWIVLIALPASLIAATALVSGVINYRRVFPKWAVLIYCGSWSIVHHLIELRLMALIIWPLLGIAIIFQSAHTNWWLKGKGRIKQ